MCMNYKMFHLVRDRWFIVQRPGIIPIVTKIKAYSEQGVWADRSSIYSWEEWNKIATVD